MTVQTDIRPAPSMPEARPSALAVPSGPLAGHRPGTCRKDRDITGPGRRTGVRAGHALVLLAALAVQQTAHAQTQAEAAAQNMQLAADICLKNLRDAPAIRTALADAGFSMTPGANGSFEAAAFGVGVYAGPDEGGFCKVDSALVPVPLAQAIVDAVVARTYTGTVTPGLPGDNANAPPTLCQGRTLWDTRLVITVSFSAAGNSGECLSDGTSAIYLN